MLLGQACSIAFRRLITTAFDDGLKISIQSVSVVAINDC